MQTTIMFKTDKKLKEAAQETARQMGIPLSAVLNQGLRDLVAKRMALFSEGNVSSVIQKEKSRQ